MAPPGIAFYYEFASTYSYLAAMRIEAEAARRNVAVQWTPFLLGPIFAAKGWETSPFVTDREKGAYMWRDLERQARQLELPFARPDTFPQNGLLAARIALAVAEDGLIAPFSRAVYRAEFGEGKDIADAGTLGTLLAAVGCTDPDGILARARQAEIKQRLKDNVAEARELGIFGAPSFVVGGRELFWGNDRLEAALDWAVAGG